MRCPCLTPSTQQGPPTRAAHSQQSPPSRGSSEDQAAPCSPTYTRPTQQGAHLHRSTSYIPITIICRHSEVLPPRELSQVLWNLLLGPMNLGAKLALRRAEIAGVHGSNAISYGDSWGRATHGNGRQQDLLPYRQADEVQRLNLPQPASRPALDF